MFKLNKDTYFDKMHACWIGKNIGGTLGAPYEGTCEFLNVEGFESTISEPLPNDDLDLQLVWLKALEDTGAAKFNSNTLADYWLDYITPSWNEYGICKENLRLGLLPPISGEFDNDKWKHSNGAWIRSEIWASLAPGLPDVAIKYAAYDAMVDHGMGEGLIAEIFVAALQSLAYIQSDIPALIDAALAKIPSNSKTAQTVNLVKECYKNKIDYEKTRNKIIELNSELGFFQAPSNIGYVTIGLLYGEGDFKKSLIYAANCGDDTDCTAGTVGATLGIIGGTSAIDDELKRNIGDKIVTMSVCGTYLWMMPKTCTEFAERITRLVPSVMENEKVEFAFTGDETEFSGGEKEKFNAPCVAEVLNRAPYSYDITNHRPFSARVELDKSPKIYPCESRKVTLTITTAPGIIEQRKLQIRLILPSGWRAENYEKNILLQYPQLQYGITVSAKTTFTVTAGENVESVNRIYAEITGSSIAAPVIVPITFVG